ncbi:uncharacterized protein ACIQIH_012745 isoform 1-T2 [Cyanocitta cristata]
MEGEWGGRCILQLQYKICLQRCCQAAGWEPALVQELWGKFLCHNPRVLCPHPGSVPQQKGCDGQSSQCGFWKQSLSTNSVAFLQWIIRHEKCPLSQAAPRVLVPPLCW